MRLEFRSDPAPELATDNYFEFYIDFFDVPGVKDGRATVWIGLDALAHISAHDGPSKYRIDAVRANFQANKEPSIRKKLLQRFISARGNAVLAAGRTIVLNREHFTEDDPNS